MVELNHRQRTIKIKIVYYGPPVGGKTTNLQVLHQHADAQRRGELVSINSAQDRTILFDLLPLKVPGFRGFDLRLQILTVPGQAMYAATRRLVLKGADSVVFVANSATDRWEENVQSFREMTENLLLHQLDPAALPLVLQYNKRDLPATTAIDFMDRTLNVRKVDALPAVAVTGQGVLETFAAVLSRTVYDLAVRYQIVDVGRGQPLQQWTRQAMLGMFGATALAEEAPLFESAGGMPLVTSARAAPAPVAAAVPRAGEPSGPPPSARVPALPAMAPAPSPSARVPALPATPPPTPASPPPAPALVAPAPAVRASAASTAAPPAPATPAATPSVQPVAAVTSRAPVPSPSAATAPAPRPAPAPPLQAPPAPAPASVAPTRAPQPDVLPAVAPFGDPAPRAPVPPMAPLRMASPEAWAPGPELEPWSARPAGRSGVLRLDPVLEAQHLGPEARAQETLVESYVQASARLTSDMAELREERDLAQRRLEDLRQALLAAQDIVAGQPLATTLDAVLGHMAGAAGARHASLLVPLPTGVFQAALLRELRQDPLLRMPAGPRHVTDQFRHEAEPRLHRAEDSLDLGDALLHAAPRFEALVAVPLRTTRGLQALAMLYYSADDVRPSEAILEHLGLVAGTLSSALELASATAALQQDETVRQLALVGAAAMRGLEEVLAPLLLFRDRLGVLRRRADAPGWLQKECDRLIPTLSRALGQARSLLGFGRGDIQREVVDANELLSDQSAQGLEVRIPPGQLLWGDPALLRLAIAALVERVRDTGRGPVRLMIDAPSRRVRVRIGPGAEADFCREPGLGFVHKVLDLHKSELLTETDTHGVWFSFAIDPA